MMNSVVDVWVLFFYMFIYQQVSHLKKARVRRGRKRCEKCYTLCQKTSKFIDFKDLFTRWAAKGVSETKSASLVNPHEPGLFGARSVFAQLLTEMSCDCMTLINSRLDITSTRRGDIKLLEVGVMVLNPVIVTSRSSKIVLDRLNGLVTQPPSHSLFLQHPILILTGRMELVMLAKDL